MNQRTYPVVSTPEGHTDSTHPTFEAARVRRDELNEAKTFTDHRGRTRIEDPWYIPTQG